MNTYLDLCHSPNLRKQLFSLGLHGLEPISLITKSGEVMLKFLTNLFRNHSDHKAALNFAKVAKSISVGESRSGDPKIQTQEFAGIYIDTSNPLHKEEAERFWWFYDHPLFCEGSKIPMSTEDKKILTEIIENFKLPEQPKEAFVYNPNWKPDEQ